MMPGYRICSRDLPARLAAGGARTWGWTSTGKSNRPAGWAIAEVGQMSHHVFSVGGAVNVVDSGRVIGTFKRQSMGGV
jgi:hypothetical protein